MPRRHNGYTVGIPVIVETLKTFGTSQLAGVSGVPASEMDDIILIDTESVLRFAKMLYPKRVGKDLRLVRRIHASNGVDKSRLTVVWYLKKV